MSGRRHTPHAALAAAPVPEPRKDSLYQLGEDFRQAFFAPNLGKC